MVVWETRASFVEVSTIPELSGTQQGNGCAWAMWPKVRSSAFRACCVSLVMFRVG